MRKNMSSLRFIFNLVQWIEMFISTLTVCFISSGFACFYVSTICSQMINRMQCMHNPALAHNRDNVVDAA